jgi:hypothetical protein
MFSATFRPNGAQIKIRKGACVRGHDMQYPQSCPLDLVEDRLPPGDLDTDREEPGVGRGAPARDGRTRGGGFRRRNPIGVKNCWSAELALLEPVGV